MKKLPKSYREHCRRKHRRKIDDKNPRSREFAVSPSSGRNFTNRHAKLDGREPTRPQPYTKNFRLLRNAEREK